MEKVQPTKTQILTKFWSNSQKAYDSLAKKEPSTVYFCSDTQQIYKGDNCYTSSVKIVDCLPTIVRKDILYIIRKGDSAGGYVYPSTGSEWQKVICGDVFTAKSLLTLADIPAATQTKDGLLTAKDKTTYDNSLEKVKTIETKYPVTIEYRETADRTKTYTFKQGGKSIGKVDVPRNEIVESGSIVFVPADTIKQDGEYLPEGKYLKLSFVSNSSDDVYISLADLASLYTPGDGIDIKDNKISVNIDTNKGLAITDDGKLGLNLANLDIGSCNVSIKTDPEVKVDMPLEEIMNKLYESSVWKNM